LNLSLEGNFEFENSILLIGHSKFSFKQSLFFKVSIKPQFLKPILQLLSLSIILFNKSKYDKLIVLIQNSFPFQIYKLFIFFGFIVKQPFLNSSYVQNHILR
jgi:hypothetical protein